MWNVRFDVWAEDKSWLAVKRDQLGVVRIKRFRTCKAANQYVNLRNLEAVLFSSGSWGRK